MSNIAKRRLYNVSWLKPYARLPIAIKDSQGELFTRAKVKGWYTHMYYDNRSTGGGYHSIDIHISNQQLMFGKYIWSKKQLRVSLPPA